MRLQVLINLIQQDLERDLVLAPLNIVPGLDIDICSGEVGLTATCRLTAAMPEIVVRGVGCNFFKYPKMPSGFWIAKSLSSRQLSSQSLRYVAWTRSSTSDREGSPQIDAVRRIVRLMDFPTRATNSAHAASSHGPAQRQTTACKDNDEYRVGLGLSSMLLFKQTGTLPQASVLP